MLPIRRVTSLPPLGRCLAGRLLLSGVQKRFHGLGTPVKEEKLPKEDPCYRIAICGAGPAGLATLKELGRRWTTMDHPPGLLHVDVFEAALVPMGLIRLGVAPDHTAIKAVGDGLVEEASRFQDMQEDQFKFDFYGGVQLGKFLQLGMLRKYYDAVVLTTGVANVGEPHERPILGIEGEHGRGVVSVEDVVEFYNGRPLCPPGYLYEIYSKVPGVMVEMGQWTMDSQMLDYSLARGRSETSQVSGVKHGLAHGFGRFFDDDYKNNQLVIVGQGNVSADVVRMFLKDPAHIDCRHLPEAGRRLLEKLRNKYLKEIHILGRRGFLQANWDIATLRELFRVNENCTVLCYPDEFRMSVEHPTIARAIRRNRPLQRMVALMEEAVANFQMIEQTAEVNESGEVNFDPTARGPDALNVWLRFCLAPTKLILRADPDGENSVNAVEVARTKLTLPKGGKVSSDFISIVPDDPERELIDRVRMVVKSLGYGVARRDHVSPWLKFDTRPLPSKKLEKKLPAANPVAKIVRPNEVFHAEVGESPVFAAGWVRSGGKGSLADTITDANRTVEQVISELRSKEPSSHGAATRLTLTLVVPEIGIPVDWNESMEMLKWEKDSGQKITDWRKAADLVNNGRQQPGARVRGINWHPHSKPHAA